MFFGQDYFNHRDHRITGFAALDAVAPAAAMPLYFPEAGPAHQVSTVLLSGTLEPDVWVDISATVDRKGEAVGCHRSQFPDGGEWAATAVRLAAEDAGSPGRGAVRRGVPETAPRGVTVDARSGSRPRRGRDGSDRTG